ncbi:Tetratricopeptide repeat [Arabidopsis thaliana x Arabidopsis arenosa]|uniref:Tetratricopeptide repeat n=1 Tax=Arabidopsis thaliana x Arabidopsis arenosa TaxID=1240361 RepID=A0A8T1ZM12_9BRAS|nr:Tetratricopeptide repeat [Arabidopsis thaliana x Arabidopsis arenosa]
MENDNTKEIVLRVPAFNVINGGSHAGNKLAMQEFMILPVGASSFKEAMKMGLLSLLLYLKISCRVNMKVLTFLDATNVGDEGGFAPNIQENKEGLELLKTAIEKTGYTGKVVIGMDVAASEFYSSDKKYDLNFKEENNDGSQKISGDALKDMYKSFVSEYPNVSIEDPFDQDDWENYAKMTVECGEKVQIVGDDLLVTNPKRVEKTINERSCKALLLKSIEAVKMSKRAGWGVMASHHSGETEDTFIVDLSVELIMHTGSLAKYEYLQGIFSFSNYIQAQTAKAQYCLREFDHVEIMFGELVRNDPYRMEDMDLYSNVLYAKEACAALSYLAHKVVLTDKYRPESCCIIGNYYNLKGQHEKAVMYFQRALKLNKYLSAWTPMGHEYVEMKNTHAAIDAYRRAVDINPCDYRAWYGLGQAYEMMGMPFYALYYGFSVVDSHGIEGEGDDEAYYHELVTDLKSLLDTDDDDILNRFYGRLAILASDAYHSLLLSTNCPVFTFFSPIAFLSLLGSIRRYLKRRDDSAGQGSNSQREKGNKKKRGRDCE